MELCGHATIGSFHALRGMGLVADGDSCINETLSGTLEIVVGKDAILMDMAKPQAFESLDTPEQLAELYQVMGLSHKGQGAVVERAELSLLPRKVSTGLTDIMMPVANEAELEKIAPDFPALTELSRRYNVVGVHAFTVNTADGLIHARNFAPLYDIDEEAATGTSNGALVYYLYLNGLVALDKVYTVVAAGGPVPARQRNRRSLFKPWPAAAAQNIAGGQAIGFDLQFSGHSRIMLTVWSIPLYRKITFWNRRYTPCASTGSRTKII